MRASTRDRRRAARRRRSAGSIDRARCRVSAVPATSKGLTPKRGLGELLPGAGLVGEDEHPFAAVEQRALLGHQVEAVAHRVDQQDVGDGQRGQRAGAVVFDVQDDGVHVGGPPGVVDPLGRVRDFGPEGEIVGQPLPRGIDQRDVHDLVRHSG